MKCIVILARSKKYLTLNAMYSNKQTIVYICF